MGLLVAWVRWRCSRGWSVFGNEDDPEAGNLGSTHRSQSAAGYSPPVSDPMGGR